MANSPEMVLLCSSAWEEIVPYIEEEHACQALARRVKLQLGLSMRIDVDAFETETRLFFFSPLLSKTICRWFLVQF